MNNSIRTMLTDVEYETSDSSIGYVMKISKNTSFKTIINFVGDYGWAYNATISIMDFLIKDDTDYLYVCLNKVLRRVVVYESLDEFREFEVSI